MSIFKETLFVSFQEISAGVKIDEDTRKQMLSATSMEIDEKFGQKKGVDIYARVFLQSQHINGLSIPVVDRRVYPYEERNNTIQEPEYYKRIDHAVWHGGLPARVKYELLNMDLGDFNPKTRPPVSATWHDIVESSSNIYMRTATLMTKDVFPAVATPHIVRRVFHEVMQLDDDYISHSKISKSNPYGDEDKQIEQVLQAQFRKWRDPANNKLTQVSLTAAQAAAIATTPPVTRVWILRDRHQWLNIKSIAKIKKELMKWNGLNISKALQQVSQ
jgi:hypothetical protein